MESLVVEEENSDNISCVGPELPIDLESAAFIGPIFVLGVINAIVILGNSLVIAAVFTCRKLRTVTNQFIVSLACADLLLGCTVLPFSVALEGLDFWVFGRFWCNVWLAMDVWMCTASIFNLCAISLDRYLAITRPFRYPKLMSSTRGKYLVAGVWVLSFIICFPPLVGWKNGSADVDMDLGSNMTVAPPITTGFVVVGVHGMHNFSIYNLYNYSYFLNESDPEEEGDLTELPNCVDLLPQCQITNSSPSYIVYSACGSFWIPMLIMCFFYWRIYRAAVKTTCALNRGVITTKMTSDMNGKNPQTMTLRVHRGGGGSRYQPRSSTRSLNTSTNSSGGCGSSSNGYRRSNNELGYGSSNRKSSFLGHHTLPPPRLSPPQMTGSADSRRNTVCMETLKKQPWSGHSSNGHSSHSPSPPRNHKRTHSKKARHSSFYSSAHRGMQRVPIEDPLRMQHSEGEEDDNRNKRATSVMMKSGKRNIRLHLQKLNKEKKAAKTLAIIVGCFIVCWAPFFTMYILAAFCSNCEPSAEVFSVIMWLGYINSAINPCIYALFAKDFRYAFKKLVCCRVQRRLQRPRGGVLGLLSSLRLQTSSKDSDSISDTEHIT